MIHVILHSLLEFIQLLPFLFLSYLLLEWVEHKMKEKTKLALAKGGAFAPAVGGLLGAVPQCGFSSVAAGLYAGKILSLGTLIAVFLSTSDEMLPIVLSHATTGEVALWSVVRVLLGKIVIGILCGFVVDLVIRLWRKHHGHHHDHHHDDHDHHGHHIGEMCEHDGCNCGEKGIWLSSLLHTAKTGAFILLMILTLNMVIHFVGEDKLSLALAWASSSGVGHFIIGLAGLIPNCASSVLITELYLTGGMSTGMLYAGLLTGAGVGTLVLFRTNRNWKQNLLILLTLWGIGVLFGGLIDLLGLDFLGLVFIK